MKKNGVNNYGSTSTENTFPNAYLWHLHQYIKTMHLEVQQIKDQFRCEICWMTANLKSLSKKVLDGRMITTVN